jgi:hypothetical protein
MFKPKPLSLAKAIDLLHRPGTRLAKLHKAGGGHEFYIWPNGGPVSDATARALLERSDLQPYDTGLLPGCPQSWRLGDWRAWEKAN